MFLKKIHKWRHTLALRLTIWYGAIFAVSSVLAFALVYGLIAAFVTERTDDDLRETLAEFSAFFAAGGLDRVSKEMAVETAGDEAEKTFLRLWTADGRRLVTTDVSSWSGLSDLPAEVVRDVGDGTGARFETFDLPSHQHGIRRMIGSIGAGVVFEAGQTLAEDEELLAAILHGFLMTLAVVFLLGGPIGWFMARRALRGVEAVTRTANEIAHGALDQRVSVRSHGDELDNLAQTFNTMLDRIQALIIGMREMTDNLAHDLRSPLARIRAGAEMSLANGDTNAAGDSLALNTIEECDRLLDMVNTTLDIAEAESGAAKLNLGRVDLVEIVDNAYELFQTIAEDRRLTLVTRVPARCLVEGDRQRLQRLVANLLDNALKYTLAGGEVQIVLQQLDQRVLLSIEDTGVGISAEDLPRIFQRFYRCDRSRSQSGIGLGLNLARAFARAHGGDIIATSNEGVGSVFTVMLPRSLYDRSGYAPRQSPAALIVEKVDG
ncbi:MAG: HAMP domain-containing protein [Gammaproteobacteria bacterium]|nr:HAMP domain-containing protein [Gammaproteobacteria bacterium]